ncbi:MAG TPA: hypothetical protein VFA12_06820 [Stellaceae bacterium]|nr:hypothetical protein [Stellaceae bacterium]
MNKDDVKEMLARVLTWPQDRQQQAMRVLAEIEAQETTRLRLSNEQVAEINRRLADPQPRFLTLDEVRERSAPRGA